MRRLWVHRGAAGAWSQAWQVLDEELVSLTELESMMGDIGLVESGTIRQTAVWQRLQLPGNPAKRAFARACHLDAFTFEDLCLVVEMSLLPTDLPRPSSSPAGKPDADSPDTAHLTRR